MKGNGIADVHDSITIKNIETVIIEINWKKSISKNVLIIGSKIWEENSLSKLTK